MQHVMKLPLARLALFVAALLAGVGTLEARTPAGEGFAISLKTIPAEVQAGKEFEMIWRISADKAEVLEAHVDCADAFGPEHSWGNDAPGVFEVRVKRKEAQAGFKEYELWAKLKQGERTRFVGESFQINVGEAGGDRDLADFLAWMKRAGYSEEIIRIHAHDGTKPKVRAEWNRYFATRKKDMAYREMKTMPVLFIDLIAEDGAAINKPMQGQTELLEPYMARIYGKDFKIHYEQQEVSYEKLFGKPLLQKNAKGQEWLKFDPGALNKFARDTAKRLTRERRLPPNGVMIRWAVKKWKQGDKELSIQDHTGSGPAISGYDFNGYGLGIYAHEWGHGLGLGHMFVNGPGSYSSRIWGLDCIMNHSYVAYANKESGRLLSPLLRYVLEPKKGFTDQKSFAGQYNKAMAGTTLLKKRLKETETDAAVASTMVWTTPWQPEMSASVVCEGLQNRSYKLSKLEFLPQLKPGAYTLVVTTAGKGNAPRELAIQREGRVVASTRINWMSKVPQTITIDKHLSLVIGSNGGAGNLYGIGKLLGGRPLVVPEP